MTIEATIPFHTVPTKPQEDYNKYICKNERNIVDKIKEIQYYQVVWSDYKTSSKPSKMRFESGKNFNT